MVELMGDSLLSVLLYVLYKALASEEVVNFFQGEKLDSKQLGGLKLMLVSANVLLNRAKTQLEQPHVKTWIERLRQVLHEVERVMKENNTEAMPLKQGKGESRSKAWKCLNFSPTLFSPLNDTVKSEMEDILCTLQLLLDQREFFYLAEVEPKLPSGSFWYTTEGVSGMVCKFDEQIYRDLLTLLPANIDYVALRNDDDDSATTWNDVNGLSFSSGQISFFSDDVED
ncbi:hypothetical protein PanWU01x14_259780 [Parasponia andersonii]|uniref:Disease resistance N-terminal domain-containing protein n=1 Tax=Parasponia andersonii TaxID=3476 RepID=A0A2P5B900_PARAD|nr:hypothetical protein PanWU01x14_259780 [Parasponia andersonii]